MDSLAADILLTVLAIFVGSLVLVIAGFGIAIGSSPIMLLTVDPQSTVIIINTVSLLIFVLMIYQNRRHINYREMTVPVIFGMMGVPVGLYILSNSNPSALRVSIALLIIFLGLVMALNPTIVAVRHKFTLWGAAFLVSAMITSTGIGGPIMAIAALSREWDRDSIRGSLPYYYLFIETTAVIGYFITGMFDSERLILTGVSIFPALLGFLIGSMLVKKINQSYYRRLILGIVICAGTVILVKEIFI
ncbi:MAG: sulfite exporter TauE/SafE family protein [Dehalococcoidia bacterium]|nr:sulfite exporter TauE/SafE family protein [Dehalococcoidia bacterium]